MSPSTWATGCSPTSAGPRRTRTTPSGRCAPRLTSSRGVGSLRPRPDLSTAGPGRHCHRASGSGRADRRRGGAGAVGGRRDAELGRAAAGTGRAQWRGDQPEHAAARRRSVRSRRPGRRMSSRALPAPVRAWRVHRRRPSRGPVRSVARGRLTPLVGREEELALLLRRWEQARDGEGQVVLLSGEPGIGKSRLTRALQQRLAEDTYTRFSTSARLTIRTARSTRSSIICSAQRRLGRDDDDEQKLDKAGAIARPVDGRRLESDVPLFAALLSIPTGGRYPPLDLAPEEQKARTLEALGGAGRRLGAAAAGADCCSRTCTGSIRPRWNCWIC